MITRILYFFAVIAVSALIGIPGVFAADTRTGTVLPADRLSIEQPRYSGQWKGNDLTVEYSYSKNRDQMDLSGNVRFSYSMTMGYTGLRDFRLGALLLDQNGKVLEEIGLATGRDSFDPIPFNRRINLPPNAVFIAFSYQGRAVDIGRGKTSFWFSPVH